MLRVLRDDHKKRMSRVTVDVARERTLTVKLLKGPSIGQNMQPFVMLTTPYK